MRAIRNMYSSSCKALLSLSKFDYNFFRKFSNILKYKIFYINSTSGSRSVTLGRTDRETDIWMENVIFQNFARAQITRR